MLDALKTISKFITCLVISIIVFMSIISLIFHPWYSDGLSKLDERCDELTVAVEDCNLSKETKILLLRDIEVLKKRVEVSKSEYWFFDYYKDLKIHAADFFSLKEIIDQYD